MLDYINDSGAGRSILSVKGLKKQGFSEKMIKTFEQKAKQPMLFECGGGDIPAYTSLQITSPVL